MFENLKNLINDYLVGESDKDPDHLVEKVEAALEENQITQEQYNELMKELEFH